MVRTRRNCQDNKLVLPQLLLLICTRIGHKEMIIKREAVTNRNSIAELVSLWPAHRLWGVIIVICLRNYRLVKSLKRAPLLMMSLLSSDQYLSFHPVQEVSALGDFIRISE